LREHRICRRVDVVHTFHLKDVAQGINQTNVSKSLHIAHLDSSHEKVVTTKFSKQKTTLLKLMIK